MGNCRKEKESQLFLLTAEGAKVTQRAQRSENNLCDLSVLLCALCGLIIVTIILPFKTGFSQSGFAPMKDQAAFSKKLKAVTQNTTSLESRFTQEKNLSVISEKIISKGNFYFKKENKLRWEYTEPYSYIVVMNGEKVLIKDEMKENRFDAGSNKLFAEVNSIMVGSIRGTILEDNVKFKASFFEGKDFNLVKLTPLNSQLKSFISQIRIYFNKETYTVARLEMEEPSGDFTKIEFSGLKINTTIRDEVFTIR